MKIEILKFVRDTGFFISDMIGGVYLVAIVLLFGPIILLMAFQLVPHIRELSYALIDKYWGVLLLAIGLGSVVIYASPVYIILYLLCMLVLVKINTKRRFDVPVVDDPLTRIAKDDRAAWEETQRRVREQ